MPTEDVTSNTQITAVVNLIRTVLGADVLGIYLYGSAVVGGVRPRSDFDILVVSDRSTTPENKKLLIKELLVISRAPRSVEVTIIVRADVVPWQYPPRFDFQYGDWLRKDFERGVITPWKTTVNPDLALLLTMAFQHHKKLYGADISQVLSAVPRDDVVRALLGSADSLLDDLEWDTCNVLLSLARSWCTITHQLLPKDEAALWAIARLPEPLRPVLEHARHIYRGSEQDTWDDLKAVIKPCALYIAGQIKDSAN